MLRVAFVGTFAARLHHRVRDRLDVPCQLTVVDETAIMSRLADVDVLVTIVFNRAMAAVSRRLKLVQVPAAGLDRIDPSALPQGVWLANAYGHEVGIAEYVIGAILAWNRGLCRADALLRRGEWDSQWAASSPPPPARPELRGKTLGVLGYGRIGQALARRARAFDMAIWAIRRDPAQPVSCAADFLGGPDALETLLRHADYLVVTSPLTSATRGVLGERELALMKPTAVLVNVARAEIVDEEALYQALRRSTIAGAILDVWYRYPTGVDPTRPARLPFHELGNVLMTPHVSGWTEGMLEARADVIAENIRRIAREELPLNLISTGGQ
jgi:phosphoglycerate dehydrogenase-like enzyme